MMTTAASGLYGRTAAAAVRMLLCGAAASMLLTPPLAPAYPAALAAPAEPYSAASVTRGGALYGENCVSCHGLSGRGDGAAALTPGQRWDVINFIRARAAGVRVREIGGEITAAAYPVPEFAFEADGVQDTLRRKLEQGPVLLVLCGPSAPLTRLQELAALRQRLTAARLQVLAVDLDEAAGKAAHGEGANLPLIVRVSGDVRAALALFRAPADGGETELMLDNNGNVRARWTAHGSDGLPDSDTLIAATVRVARAAVAAPNHAGHAH